MMSAHEWEAYLLYLRSIALVTADTNKKGLQDLTEAACKRARRAGKDPVAEQAAAASTEAPLLPPPPQGAHANTL